MTDRAKGCYVAFTGDIRTDDVEAIVNAIMMVKGVADVKLNIVTPDDWMNRVRIRSELEGKLLQVLQESPKP